MPATHKWPTKRYVSVHHPRSNRICLPIRSLMPARNRRGSCPSGYGFLSENAGFAERLEKEGIVFIGPKHYSIAAMGDKMRRES